MIEKPALISDKRIDEAIESVDKRQSLLRWWSGGPELRAIAQAQLDADWEYFMRMRVKVTTWEVREKL